MTSQQTPTDAPSNTPASAQPTAPDTEIGADVASGLMPSGPALYAAVRELTGFDATALPGTGTAVAVTGIGGTGVRTVIEACGELAPEIVTEPTGGGRRPADQRVGIALMVLDPSSSVGEEEKRLLYDLRSRFGIVALVCNKIDAFWDWPRIVRAHRAFLDPHEQLPVFAVSSVAALAGAADESGVGGLVDWMREMLAAPPDLRAERARVTTAIGAIDFQLEKLRRAAADAAPFENIDDLTRRRRVLVESRDRGRVDRLGSVRAGLARVRTESAGATQDGIRALSATASARCSTLTARTVDDYVDWLAREGDDLTVRIDQAAQDGIGEVASTALIGTDVAEPNQPDPSQPDPNRHDAEPTSDPADTAGQFFDEPLLSSSDATPTPSTPTPFQREVPTGRRGAEDVLMVVVGASSGLGLGRLIVTPMAQVQTLQWISMPLTLILGVAVAGLVIRVRRAATLRNEMRSWTSDALAEIRARIDQRVSMRIGAAEPRMTGQLGRFHERRTRQLSEQITALDDRIRAVRSGSVPRNVSESASRARDLHRMLDRRARALMGEDPDDQDLDGENLDGEDQGTGARADASEN